jgi:hypothetical protein
VPLEEAVQLRRALTDAYPSAHGADLAISLENVASMLGGAGNPAATLAASEEASQIRRTLTER